MADREILSREEIEALLSGVDQVAEAADALESDAEVRAYDLASQDHVVGGRLPTLELLGEKFARQLRLDMQQLLRYPIEVGAGGVQIQKYSDYAASLYVPTSISIVRFAPLSGHGLVVIDAKLVSRMVDQYFGGDGKNISVEGRDFTPTEKRVVEKVLDLIYRDLADAWSEALPVTLTTTGSESNPALVNLFSDDEVMMVNSYHIELESGGGEIHIALPYAVLEPHKSVLDTSVKTEIKAKDEAWRPALQSRLLTCEVPLRCEIANRTLLLREVLSLKVGDFITVDMPDVHQVFAGEVPSFAAKLGESKGNLALEYVSREVAQ